jgi:hypothetical protein
MIMHRLNHRPRKRLNWRTPHQVFMQSFNPVHFVVESAVIYHSNNSAKFSMLPT